MNRPSLRPTRTVIIAGAVTLLLGGGTAVAAAAVMSSNSPVSSTGVIDACWTNAEVNGSHVIVLQDQGTTCPKGTTPISWNESGAPGPTGPAGPTGPTGPTGPAGPSGAAGPAGANGSPGAGAVVADSAPASACPNGGITVTDGSNNTGYVCNGADGSPGPSGPSGPSGPAGPSGPSGPAGPPGSAGGLSNITDLNGLGCTTTGGASGAISVSIDSNQNVVLTCAVSSTAANCTHSDGLGQNYTDCNDLLGTPGDQTTYNRTMASDAANAYLNSLRAQGNPQQVGPFALEPGDTNVVGCTAPAGSPVGSPPGAVFAVELAVLVPDLSVPTHADVQITVWAYGTEQFPPPTGLVPAAGHVSQQTVKNFDPNSPPTTVQCPTTTDPTWT